ncbi:hypothetical protein D3C83_127120 [compost metagenome]
MLTVPSTVYVTHAPAGRLTVSTMSPAPAMAQVPPPEPTQVQVGPDSAAGKVSLTVEPGASLGPAFEATMV